MKSIKCFFGFHDWKTTSQVKCKALCDNILTGATHRVPALAKIQSCSRCQKYRGVITDGVTTTEIDADFLIADSDGLLKRP